MLPCVMCTQLNPRNQHYFSFLEIVMNLNCQFNSQRPFPTAHVFLSAWWFGTNLNTINITVTCVGIYTWTKILFNLNTSLSLFIFLFSATSRPDTNQQTEEREDPAYKLWSGTSWYLVDWLWNTVRDYWSGAHLYLITIQWRNHKSFAFGTNKKTVYREIVPSFVPENEITKFILSHV